MKILGKSLALAAVTGALTAGALVPATSASAEDHRLKEGGMATITIDDSSSFTVQTVKNVGGGTWSYGTALASNGLKTCYSNYVHPSKYHSSTAVLAGGTDKKYANARSWTNAHVTAGHAYTCHVYWGTY
ncbi:lactococcin 972 family bacteriocin [Streptomyces sp. NPDC029216]|uniref:lactococcin 972 family bacteriocin n=1 Tax=Streptomyces sp. NPDC029216 TaxID=3154701 RepID=UPI0033EE4E8F